MRTFLIAVLLAIADLPAVGHSGPVYYAWEARWDNNTVVGWARIPTVYYGLPSCVKWAVMVMNRDMSEQIVCRPEGVKP